MPSTTSSIALAVWWIINAACLLASTCEEALHHVALSTHTLVGEKQFWINFQWENVTYSPLSLQFLCYYTLRRYTAASYSPNFFGTYCSLWHCGKSLFSWSFTGSGRDTWFKALHACQSMHVIWSKHGNIAPSSWPWRFDILLRSCCIKILIAFSKT